MKNDQSIQRERKRFNDQQNSILAIQCFKQNNFQMAYELVRELLRTDPNNPILFQIKGACQMLSKERRSPQQAAVSYALAMKLNPNELAYVNNFACTFINKKKYQQGLQLLSPIENKWNHPTIYYNILRCYQNMGAIQQVMAYIQKKNLAETYFPDYEKDNGLIHSFLLGQQQNTSFASQLDRQILDGLKALQIQFIMSQKFSQLSQQLQNNVKIRKQQQNCFGIQISNQMKIIILAATNFLQITQEIKKNYKQSRQILLSIIQQIDQLVSELFATIKVNNVENFNKKQLQEKITNGFLAKCQKIRYKLLKYVNLFKTDQEFENDQNNVTRYTRKFYKRNEQHFLKRQEDLEDIQSNKVWKMSLKIQKYSQVPLATILSDDQDTFVYLKPANFLQLNSMNRQCRRQIQKLSSSKRELFLKFYWTLTFMTKFYNYYGQKDVLYKKQGVQSALSELTLTQFIEKVYPLFPQIPIQFDLLQNIGRVCRQIHYGVILYLVQCEKKDLNRFLKKAMKKISKICQQEFSISNFILEILSNQQYINFLMTKEALSIKKQKHLDYFRWRIFSYVRYHEEEFSDKLLTLQDQFLIQNCIILIIGLMEVNDSDLDGFQVLIQTYCDCYINTSRKIDLKSQIAQSLYRVNHKETILQKISENAKRILKKMFL